ncbi:putative mitogen-activated protein kinase kinase kinase kinase 3, partial [Operophtera brumata]
VIKLEPGDDFAIIQQEILMMKDCRHANIIAYMCRETLTDLSYLHSVGKMHRSRICVGRRSPGGYLTCTVWGKCIELAELQPPMFELHPMRVLFLMSKSGFKPPSLRERERWTPLFHGFRLAIDLLHKYSNPPTTCQQELDDD